jgi:hypothetical protein
MAFIRIALYIKGSRYVDIIFKQFIVVKIKKILFKLIVFGFNGVLHDVLHDIPRDVLRNDQLLQLEERRTDSGRRLG